MYQVAVFNIPSTIKLDKLVLSKFKFKPLAIALNLTFWCEPLTLFYNP